MANSQRQKRSVDAVSPPKPRKSVASSKKNEKPSPVIAQYLELKAINPGYLMMIQLGDFYELFFEDAILASEKLGLTLTKRGTYQGQDIPMAGVPIRTINDYLQKAIKAGFNVAIIDQLEDPAEAKKRGHKAVVKRDVTRLVTPGTLTEDTLLEAGENNYLSALFQNPSEPSQPPLFSLASLDISTGEFLVSEIKADDLNGEIARLNPSELLLSDTLLTTPEITPYLAGYNGTQTPVPHATFSSLSGEEALKASLKVKDLEGFGTYSRGELAAIGAVLKYVELTQTGHHPLIRPPARSEQTNHMAIDAATRSNLELIKSSHNIKKGSLFAALDRTVTGSGARALAAQISAPLYNVDAINNRLNVIEFFLNNSTLRDNMRTLIRRTPDMARALSRLSLNRGGPKDLGAIKNGLIAADDLLKNIETINQDHLPKLIKTIHQHLLFANSKLRDELVQALKDELPLQTRDGDFINPSYNDDLDEQRLLRDESRSILASLQTAYREQTDIKSLKIRHNNQFGYFVEVTQLNADQLLNGPLSEVFRHRQTLANNVRFTTEELIEIESKITQAADRVLDIEKHLFTALKDLTLASSEQISQLSTSLAQLDVFLALALLSEEENYTRPIIDESKTFQITNGRHPVVEQALRRAKSGPFIENNCALAKPSPKNTAHIWLLTGPNMAGKSTFLRQNALIAIMAQMGCYVPATKAHIGLIDRLFSRVGASDDLARGRSTFMVEMVETAAILNQASDRSLVILDEIGRGTATFDGLSIAWATIEYLHNKVKTRALFATHYHELTCLREKHPNITNATIEVKEWNDDIVFLHQVVMGAADRSYGIQVAKLAGLPTPVIARAQDVLKCLESEAQESGAINQLNDLPLFSLDAPSEPQKTTETPTENPNANQVYDELKALNPDDLTPRKALDLIYKLKATINT